MTESFFFYLASFFSLMFTIILHEAGHAVTSRLLGGRPVMYHVYVVHHPLSARLRAIVAASGPFFSLIQGLICLALFEFLSTSIWGLIALWLSLYGLANFFGYLITTPFWDDGDFGKIAKLLNWSRISRYLIGAIGFIAMPFLTNIAANHFNTISNLFSVSGSNIYYCLIIFPWLFACVASALMSYPVPFPHILSYPFFSCLFLVPLYWSPLSDNKNIAEKLSTYDFLILGFLSAVICLIFLKLRSGYPVGQEKPNTGNK